MRPTGHSGAVQAHYSPSAAWLRSLAELETDAKVMRHGSPIRQMAWTLLNDLPRSIPNLQRVDSGTDHNFLCVVFSVSVKSFYCIIQRVSLVVAVTAELSIDPKESARGKPLTGVSPSTSSFPAPVSVVQREEPVLGKTLGFSHAILFGTDQMISAAQICGNC